MGRDIGCISKKMESITIPSLQPKMDKRFQSRGEGFLGQPFML
jgi:hypothetical protein